MDGVFSIAINQFATGIALMEKSIGYSA